MLFSPLVMTSVHRWYDETGTLRQRTYKLRTLYNLSMFKHLGGHYDPPSNDN